MYCKYCEALLFPNEADNITTPDGKTVLGQVAAVEELFRGMPFRCGSACARTFGHAVLHDVLKLHRAEVRERTPVV